MRCAPWRFVVALNLGFPLCQPVQATECARTPHECAIFYLEHQNFQAAIRSLTAELRQSPRNLNALNLLGIALTGAGHPEKAAGRFKEALVINPHFYPARKNLAINGEFAMAVGELQEAVALSPDFIEAHYQLGLALRQSAERSSADRSAPDHSSAESSAKDRSTGAETSFQRVLQLNPNDAPAHLQLGLLFEARGDKAQASSHFEKALQLAPGLTEAHLRLGRLATSSKDWATAVREFEAVLAWDAVDAEAHYDLAVALKARGQLEDAAHELQIAQRLNPALPAAR